MAYGEYADSGRSTGKLLYQLSKLGLPLQIVDSVIFQSQGKISYCNKPFATYEWCITDTPIFIFLGEYSHYNEKLKQPKLLNLEGLLKERKNMQAALLFYSDYVKKLNSAKLTNNEGIQNIANFCLGQEIPESEVQVAQLTLMRYVPFIL